MRISRRGFIVSAASVAATTTVGTAYAMETPSAAVPIPARAGQPLLQAASFRFTDAGHTEQGDWQADISISAGIWEPGMPLKVEVTLQLPDDYLAKLKTNCNIEAEQFIMLVTAERTFDAEGWMRLANDERMSTLLTPTGLAIEGGTNGGALTTRLGFPWKGPIDELVTRPVSALVPVEGSKHIHFSISPRLPSDLPPGIYRLRLDFGVVAKKRRYCLDGHGFGTRAPYHEVPVNSYIYSPPIRAYGTHASGTAVDASTIQPCFPWVILAGYNSNGYRGVIADEDKGRFALSERHIIPDEVILPLYNEKGNAKLSYSLEPTFPVDTIDAFTNIPWNYASGEYSVQVTGPDGRTQDLGTAAFVEKKGFGPTTKNPAFTAWKPQQYGRYIVRAAGWIMDQWGNRYQGGGTYRFWIAKRMTMATATFQGQAYSVGNRYGRDIGFAPAVPADVEITATLYVDSDPNQARTVTCSGKATPGGIFGAAQGMKPLPFEAPGEYHATVQATYTDPEGHLWVCAMRHAGVVYPPDSPIEAHGKKLAINRIVNGKQVRDLVDTGETHFEGYVPAKGDFRKLDHINYPYNQGDCVLIASEQQGANKIEPVLTYVVKAENTPYDPKWQGIGLTNVQIRTSNGYSPHMFPEYITDWEYFYAGAPRPGFMSRFIVGDNGTRAPYWPTSPNRFGGQIGSSANGDLPGDIYRLIGGVVVRRQGQKPMYAGYMASAFLLPKGTNNNRIISPGSEHLTSPDGRSSRFFLVGTRPGMVYEVGTSFAPAVQIDPMVPAACRFVLTFPDRRQKIWEGTGDKSGSWAATDRVTLDLPGTYRYTLEATWNGHKGHMPGLPPGGGELYVIEKERPEGAINLKIDLPNQSSFDAAGKLRIPGTSTASEVRYAAVIPGCVILQGSIPVQGGRWEYTFDPKEIAGRTQTYDIVNLSNGKPEIGRVVHLTFFSREVTPAGIPYHDFTRAIIRGNQVIVTR